MAVTVIYNGYTLPNVTEKIFFSEDYENFSFSCTFFIRENSSAAAIAEEKTMLASVVDPLERLQVSFNGNSEFDLEHDSNTALNPQVSIRKTQGNRNTETSREYEFKYDAKLPADKSGFNFRLRSNFSIDQDDSRRRTININLTYTAGGPNSARTNFDTFAEPFALGIVAAIGGNYELVRNQTNVEEDQDKFCSGSFVYQEILEDDLDGTTDDPRLTNISTDYSVDFGQSIGVSLTDNYIASPQNRINISYKVKVNKELLATNEPAGVYNSEVKPYIINNAFTRLDLLTKTTVGDFFITEDDGYSFNPNNYTFTGRLSLLAPQSRTVIIELKETLSNNIDDGILEKKVWDKKAHTYALYQMGSVERFTRSTQIIQIGVEPDEPQRIEQLEGVNFIRKNISRRKEVRREGVGELVFDSNDAETHDVFYVTFQELYLRVDEVANQQSIEGPGEEVAGGELIG